MFGANNSFRYLDPLQNRCDRIMLSPTMANQANFTDPKGSTSTHHATMKAKSDNPAKRRQNIGQNIEQLLETAILVPIVEHYALAVTIGRVKQNNIE